MVATEAGLKGLKDSWAATVANAHAGGYEPVTIERIADGAAVPPGVHPDAIRLTVGGESITVWIGLADGVVVHPDDDALWFQLVGDDVGPSIPTKGVVRMTHHSLAEFQGATFQWKPVGTPTPTPTPTSQDDEEAALLREMGFTVAPVVDAAAERWKAAVAASRPGAGPQSGNPSPSAWEPMLQIIAMDDFEIKRLARWLDRYARDTATAARMLEAYSAANAHKRNDTETIAKELGVSLIPEDQRAPRRPRTADRSREAETIVGVLGNALRKRPPDGITVEDVEAFFERNGEQLALTIAPTLGPVRWACTNCGIEVSRKIPHYAIYRIPCVAGTSGFIPIDEYHAREAARKAELYAAVPSRSLAYVPPPEVAERARRAKDDREKAQHARMGRAWAVHPCGEGEVTNCRPPYPAVVPPDAPRKLPRPLGLSPAAAGEFAFLTGRTFGAVDLGELATWHDRMELWHRNAPRGKADDKAEAAHKAAAIAVRAQYDHDWKVATDPAAAIKAGPKPLQAEKASRRAISATRASDPKPKRPKAVPAVPRKPKPKHEPKGSPEVLAFLRHYATAEGLSREPLRPADTTNNRAMAAWHTAYAKSHGESDLGYKHRAAAKAYADAAKRR